MKNFNRVLIFTLAFIFTLSKGFAQGSETLVRGVLLDPSGQPLMGAIILAEDSETGFSTGTVSSDSGEFVLKELPVGEHYNFTIKYLGFKSIKLSGYTLSQSSKINLGRLTLEESKAEDLDQVVVMESKNTSFNKVDVGSALGISKQMLDQIPTQTRDFKALANYSSQSSIPATKSERYGISIAGVKSTGIGYTIDGVNTRRGVFGGTSTDAAFIISMEAIQEFRVETNNYAVTGPRNGGGSIKAITRKGSNKTEGSAWTYYTGNDFAQNKTFSGTPVGGKLGNNFNNWQAGFRFSGPIIKDKLTFFALYDRYTTNAPDGSSLLNYDLFSATEQQNITKNDVTSLLTTLKGAGVISDDSLDGQTGTFQKNDVTQNFFFRADWSINSVHKLTGRFSYLDYVGTYNPANVFVNYMIKDRRFGWANRSFKGLLNLRSYFPSGAFNDLKINVSTDNRFLTVPFADPYASANVKVGTNGIAFGSPWWGDEEIYMTQYQLINDYSFTALNGWDMTAGTNNLIHYAKEYYPHNTGAIMDYNSTDDMKNNVINSWTRLIPTDGNPAKRYYEYPLIENSLYVQASKYLKPNLKVQLGLRWDGYWIIKKSPSNQKLKDEVGIDTPQGFSDLDNIQPRLDVTWDLKGDGKDILKFGAGMFSNEITTHGYTFALRGNGIDYRQYTINQNSSQAERDLAGDSWRKTRSNQPGAQELRSAGVNIDSAPTDIVAVDPNLQAPMTYKTNFTFTHYFADWFRASLSGYYTNTTNQNYFRELNLKAKSDPSSDGRVQYEKKYQNFGSIVQYTNADWSSKYLAGTLELAFLYKDGILNLSYTKADQRGEAPYGAGSAWIQGQGIGRSYEDYFSNVGNWNSGYVVNDKFVALLSSPSFHGFTVSGAFTIGRYERFSVRVGNDVNGIANEGGGDGRVQAGDLAYVFDPNNSSTSATIKEGLEYVLNNTSSEYRDALNESLGNFSNQNIGYQPWQHQTSLTVKKLFKIKDNNLTLRVDMFNLLNLIDNTSGYNYQITNLNLYNTDSAGKIAINKDAGKKIKRFNSQQLGRIQFGVKFEF